MSVFFATLTRDRYDSTPEDKVYFAVLALIVTGFAVLGGLYAIYTPPWQVPDEPAHYNYVAQVAAQGCCPVITPDDWDAAYLEELKAAQFPDGADLSTIAYEDHQPPLYYLAAAPIYRVSGGNLLALRLLSVAFGAGVVLAAYFVIARLLPRHKVLALATATFVAFLPQHVAILAGVNNDSLAELVLGILTVVAVTYLGNPVFTSHDGRVMRREESSLPHGAALGGLVGLAFLTKLTIYLPAVAVAGLAIWLRVRRDHSEHPPIWTISQIGWAILLALALGSVWWGRNAFVYGWPDVLAQAAHETAVTGQLRTAELIGTVGFSPYVGRLLSTTYHSFWGQFGWMGVPMPPRIYLMIGVFSLWNLVGLGLLVLLFRTELDLHPAQRAGLWLLAAIALATAVGYLGYNLNFVQFQGRYLYPALSVAGLLTALGSRGWALLVGRWLPGQRWQRALDWFPLLAVGWMPILSLVALFRYIVPNLG